LTEKRFYETTRHRRTEITVTLAFAIVATRLQDLGQRNGWACLERRHIGKA
jgi:hypothetical protein